MKRIFCPKCDYEIAIPKEKIKQWKEEKLQTTAVVCNSCAHQIRLRLTPKQAEEERLECGHILILENVFGERQEFPLFLGDNRLGRRNKDSVTDIPIITGDPSMDRHHAIIRVKQMKSGKIKFYIADDDSRVGTFVLGDILAPKEWREISDGAIITLGAASVILSSEKLSKT